MPVKKCRECKRLNKEEPFFTKPGVISGKWAFHFHDVHGISVEMLPYMVGKIGRRRGKEKYDN